MNCIFKVCLYFSLPILIILDELKKKNKTKILCILCIKNVIRKKTFLEIKTIEDLTLFHQWPPIIHTLRGKKLKKKKSFLYLL